MFAEVQSYYTKNIEKSEGLELIMIWQSYKSLLCIEYTNFSDLKSQCNQ